MLGNLFADRDRQPRLDTLGGPTMGTRYGAKLVGATASTIALIAADVQAAIEAVDAQMSTWQPHSDLSRFNASAPGDWFPVSPDVARVVAIGLEISVFTHGAFDMCVGTAVNRWGFGPGNPVTNSVWAEGGTPTFRSMAVRQDPPALRKSEPLYLDLSGIAKGFGVDAAAMALERHGITSYIVDIDGELRASGTRPDGSPWRVGLERPAAATGLQHVMTIATTAVATSGDYRRFFEIDGQRYSHTIDPRTGRPTTSNVASVTVAHPTCVRADAIATGLLVMGGVDGPAFADRHGIDALFLLRTDQGLSERLTGRIDRFL